MFEINPSYMLLDFLIEYSRNVLVISNSIACDISATFWGTCQYHTFKHKFLTSETAPHPIFTTLAAKLSVCEDA